MLKVYKDCCKNCLLSPYRIVSPQRAKEIIQETTENQTHFICHKASMKDEEIVCSSFYEKLGGRSQMIRIAERMGMIEFVEQEDSERLPTYMDMNQGY